VSEDVFELGRQVSEELRVVVLLLDVADLLLVLHLTPRQLTRHKLNHHVEQRPQVIMTTHLLYTKQPTTADPSQTQPPCRTETTGHHVDPSPVHQTVHVLYRCSAQIHKQL